MMQHIDIRGQKRKSLIDDLSFAAKRAKPAIPPQKGIASVLHKRRCIFMRGAHLLQVCKRNIAHTEQACTSSSALLDHRLPNLGVGVSPAISGGRSVQD